MGIYSLSARYLKGSTDPIPVLAEASSDLFAWANQRGQVGRLLREIIGPSFAPYAGLPTVADVANSASAMQAVVESSAAMEVLSRSTAAMNAIGASPVARQAIRNNSGAWNIVASSPMAIGKYVAGAAGLSPELYQDIYAIATSSQAVSAVAGSAEAMDAIVASTVAMTAIAESDLAMEQALLNTTWRVKIANSDTARDIVYAHLGVMVRSSRFGKASQDDDYGVGINSPHNSKTPTSVTEIVFFYVSRRSYLLYISGTVTITENDTGRTVFSSSWSMPQGQDYVKLTIRRLAFGNYTVYATSSNDVGYNLGYNRYTP